MAKQKSITIDDLAGMVQRGFLGIDKRLDGIDGRLDGIDSRLDGIDGRLDGIDSRLDGIEKRLTSLEGRMDVLEGTVRDLGYRVEALEEFNEEIIERLGRIEQKVDENYQMRLKRLEESMARVYASLALKSK